MKFRLARPSGVQMVRSSPMYTQATEQNQILCLRTSGVTRMATIAQGLSQVTWWPLTFAAHGVYTGIVAHLRQVLASAKCV